MYRFVLIVFVFLFFATRIVAQSVDPTPPPVIDTENAAAILINAITGIVMAAFGAAPVTTVIVSILKRFAPLVDVSAPTLTFLTAGVLYVGATLASLTGITIQFNSFLDFFAVAAPAVMSFLVTVIGAPAWFNAASRANVPVIGFSRSGEAPTSQTASAVILNAPVVNAASNTDSVKTYQDTGRD